MKEFFTWDGPGNNFLGHRNSTLKEWDIKGPENRIWALVHLSFVHLRNWATLHFTFLSRPSNLKRIHGHGSVMTKGLVSSIHALQSKIDLRWIPVEFFKFRCSVCPEVSQVTFDRCRSECQFISSHIIFVGVKPFTPFKVFYLRRLFTRHLLFWQSDHFNQDVNKCLFSPLNLSIQLWHFLSWETRMNRHGFTTRQFSSLHFVDTKVRVGCEVHHLNQITGSSCASVISSVALKTSLSDAIFRIRVASGVVLLCSPTRGASSVLVNGEK